MTPTGACSASVASWDSYKFTGKERDAESGLDNFGARYNASTMGRFMTPDSLRYSDLGDPQSLNLYSYVRNNPTSLYDPDGHCWQWAQKLCDAAHNVGQRFDNLFRGEGFHTDKGVEDIAHRNNAQRRQQEVSGQRAQSVAGRAGETLGRFERRIYDFLNQGCGNMPCLVNLAPLFNPFPKRPPLKVIHNEPPLQQSASYQEWSKKSTQEIIDSLTPGTGKNPLTVYPDGSIADGNTRITILQERGVDVNSLPGVPRTPEPLEPLGEPEIPEF